MPNPYYNPDKLDLELLAFEDPDAYYSFNTLCFWATKEGHIYTARDSGCSCPTPFEGFQGNTQEEVLPQLERVGSLQQADAAFDSWGLLGGDHRHELAAWFEEHFKV